MKNDRYSKANNILSALKLSNEEKSISEDKPEEKSISESKPLTFKEVDKNNIKGDTATNLVRNIAHSDNAMRVLMQIAKTLKGPQKDHEALGYDASSGQEVSKGAFKEAFKKFLGL